MVVLKPSDSSGRELLKTPRQIDLAATFNALVAWIHNDIIVKRKAPGLIVGISGTDSILTFLACAKAFERAGKPDRALGVHFGLSWPPTDKKPEQVDRILSSAPNFLWVAKTIIPWIKEQVPKALVVVDSSIDYSKDSYRWAALKDISLNDLSKRDPLPLGKNYWVVGTRNASEDELGAYSDLSIPVSNQPIIRLWKSEVLQICSSYLGVPQVAADKSRQADCICGRDDLAAKHIEEIDAILMVRNGVLSPDYLKKIPDNILGPLRSYVEDQINYSAFKKEGAQKPPPDIVIPVLQS